MIWLIAHYYKMLRHNFNLMIQLWHSEGIPGIHENKEIKRVWQNLELSRNFIRMKVISLLSVY